jgi:hypothetical protein|tara:strand:- start:624 stop:1349 length:726 start_codon:yes stop_codon:yes gene_type:complete
MNFLYYLASIGESNFEKKIDILINNINIIYKKLQSKFDIIINLYEIDEKYKNKIELLKKMESINNVYIYIKKGILTELFLNNPYNELLINYDYILFILDDVYLKYFDILDMIEKKNKYNLRIISPKVIKSTHLFMNNNKGTILTNFIECYCLLMKPEDLLLFFSLQTESNCWMWGTDLLYGYYKINVGIDFNNYAIHSFPNRINKDAYRLHLEYLKYKKLPFNNYLDILKKYSPCIKILSK